MITTKKISPTEFRLHNKVFNVDFSPENYFEKFRFEIIFQKMLFWFYIKYGIYFHIQKLKVVDEQVLFQFYYYKTYLFQRYLYNRRFNRSLQTMSIDFDKIGDEEEQNALALHVPELIRLLPQIKKGLIKRRAKRFAVKFKRKFRKQPIRFLDMFFKYYWEHYFHYQSVSLYKSLFKIMLSNKAVKKEHKDMLFKTRYMRYNKWAFDFLFFFNHFVTFYSTNLLFPFFVHHLQGTARQKPIIRLFLNVLKLLYFYKGHIKGARLLLHGPIDRHGRTKAIVFNLGVMSVTSIDSNILFDTIQCPTKYGTISIKLWICYFPRFNPKPTKVELITK